MGKNIIGLSEKEYLAAMIVIQQIREEEAKEAQLLKAKEIIDKGIQMSIDLIGAEKTKTIVREKIKEI